MKIDVYHDTVCPWCRIGKQHLNMALEQWDGDDVEINYHTFYLNPTVPPDGYDFVEYLTEKGGGRMQMEDWFARPREMGAQVGLTFNFEKIKIAPNTALSHQLIVMTPKADQEAMVDALYEAYFEDGKNIGDIEVLLDIAEAQGLERDEVQEKLEREMMAPAVMVDVQRAHQIGVRGVPFFVINDRLAFSGAHPPETILEVMQEAEKQAMES